MKKINIKKLTKILKSGDNVILYVNEQSANLLFNLDEYILDIVKSIDNKKYILYINPTKNLVQWDDNVPVDLLEKIYVLVNNFN